MQSHYRSTLDFSSEALVASEKAFKRLWEAFEILKKIEYTQQAEAEKDDELDKKINAWLDEFEEFIDDDFSTPKVLANMFEMVPVINSFKDGLIPVQAIGSGTLIKMKKEFQVYLEDIFGLKNTDDSRTEKMEGIMQLLIDIRKEARNKKDYATSDKIRNQLNELGIILKDEKDGNISWSIE